MRKIDLHIHTDHSDGALSVAQVARRARRAKVLCGICDHVSPYHKIYEAGAFDDYVADVRAHGLLLGAEYCIGAEVPVDPARLARLDYLAGGVHNVRVAGRSQYFWAPTPPEDVAAFLDAYMDTMLAALAHDPLDILAHPTYLPAPLADRYDEIWERRRCERLWAAAAERGVAVEISGRWLVPRPAQLQLALEMGLTFALGSDAHRAAELFDVAYAVAMCERFHIPEERIFLPVRRDRG